MSTTKNAISLSAVGACCLAWGLPAFEQGGGANSSTPDPAVPTLRLQLGHTMPVFHLSVDREEGLLASADMSGRIRLWSLTQAAELRVMAANEVAERYSAIVLDATHGWIAASTTTGGSVRIFNSATGTITAVLSVPAGIAKLARNDGGTLLAGLTRGGELIVWDTKEWQVLPQFRENGTRIVNDDAPEIADTWGNRPLAFGDHDRTVAIVRTDGDIETIDLRTAHVTKTEKMAAGVAAAVSANAEVAATFDYHAIRMLDLARPTSADVLPFARDGVRQIEFCGDGQRLAIGDQRTMTVIDRATRQNHGAIDFHSDVTALAFINCDRIAAGMFDGAIEVLDLNRPDTRTPLGRSAIEVRDAFLGDDSIIRINTDIGLVQWPLNERTVLLSRRRTHGADASARFTAEGGLVVVDGSSVAIESGNKKTTFSSPVTNSALVDDDGKLCAVMDLEATKIIDARSAEPIVSARHSHSAYTGTFSKHGKWFATAVLDGNLVALNTLQRTALVLNGHGAVAKSLLFTDNEETLFSGDANGEVRKWSLGSRFLSTVVRAANGTAVDSLALPRDASRIAIGYEDGLVVVQDLLQTPAASMTLTGNTLPVRHLRYDSRGWLVAATSATIRLWAPSTSTGLSLAFEPNGHWIVASDTGEFDVDAPEILEKFRWVFPDDPSRALPPEIFMRDYFEPRLLSRALAREPLPRRRALGELNRVQPEVEIEHITDEPGGNATVSVKVRRASDEFPFNGAHRRVTTDVYDVRLFRDGQLVGWAPATSTDWQQTRPVTEAADLREWRRLTRVDLETDGTKRLRFRVQVPRRADLRHVTWTAYAFNEDRVKSATATKKAAAPPVTVPRRGNAYVVTVGVNRTDSSPAWELRYAVNDARRLGEAVTERLRRSNQFESVVPIRLVADLKRDSSKEGPATGEALRTVFDRLAGRSLSTAQLATVPALRMVQRARPEDVVIVAISSHGYTDAHGVFHFVLADIGPGHRQEVTPELDARTFSGDALAAAVRAIDAGELVLVVDACESEATVNADGFKPGPMGSRGLGQLAYDKGMRVLAASKAKESAIERGGGIANGLLTYALVRKGLEARGADFQPRDGTITVGEWLAFGVDEVPRLFKEGDIRGSIAAVNGSRDAYLGAKRTPVQYQQPVLFDFSRQHIDVRLSVSGR